MADDRTTESPAQSSSPRFSSCARAAALIRQHQGRILDMWLAGAFERVPAAQDKGRAELADHFTELLDDIVDALKQRAAREARENSSDLASAAKASALHGRERSVVEGYTVGQLVHEYVILRRVLVDFCEEHGVITVEISEVITRVIEMAALMSSNAFSKSMQQVQQKLSSTLVHDVRTPLGVAYTYAELISVAEMPASRRTEAAKTITRSLRRAIAMLEDLLDIAKVRAGQGLTMKFCEADLNRELRTVCAEAKQIYSTRIVVNLEDHPVTGVYDIGLITRTVENLISNAAKFGYEDTPIRVSLKDEGDYVDLRVQNEGKPIPKAERENIFCFFSETIHRGDRQPKGWGLGLSLIRAVAANHGGEVIFESTEDKGTTFGMKLGKWYRDDGEELTILI